MLQESEDIIGASLSEPHISGTSAARVCYIIGASVSESHTYGVAGAEMRNIISIVYAYVEEPPGVQIRHVRRRRHANTRYPCARYGTGPGPTSRPTVDVGRETRQPIRATSRDRLSSDTSEEMEARIMSHPARILIARATVLPRVPGVLVRRGGTHQV